MRQVLITGGTGFVGSHMIDYILEVIIQKLMLVLFVKS